MLQMHPAASKVPQFSNRRRGMKLLCKDDTDAVRLCARSPAGPFLRPGRACVCCGLIKVNSNPASAARSSTFQTGIQYPVSRSTFTTTYSRTSLKMVKEPKPVSKTLCPIGLIVGMPYTKAGHVGGMYQSQALELVAQITHRRAEQNSRCRTCRAYLESLIGFGQWMRRFA